jgi:hypothetical protein
MNNRSSSSRLFVQVAVGQGGGRAHVQLAFAAELLTLADSTEGSSVWTLVVTILGFAAVYNRDKTFAVTALIIEKLGIDGPIQPLDRDDPNSRQGNRRKR